MATQHSVAKEKLLHPVAISTGEREVTIDIDRYRKGRLLQRSASRLKDALECAIMDDVRGESLTPFTRHDVALTIGSWDDNTQQKKRHDGRRERRGRLSWSSTAIASDVCLYGRTR